MYKAIIFDVYGTLFDMSSLKKGMTQFDDEQATSVEKNAIKSHVFKTNYATIYPI